MRQICHYRLWIGLNSSYQTVLHHLIQIQFLLFQYFIQLYTWQSAVFDPSAVVTVTMQVPSPIAVTFPLVSTVATLVLSEDQITSLLEASVGFIVAVNCLEEFTLRWRFVLSNDTDSTGTVTFTWQSADFNPSTVVTVIIQFPPPTAVTSPLASTVATEVLFEDQITVLIIASSGDIVAISVSEAPLEIERIALLSETLATGIFIS